MTLCNVAFNYLWRFEEEIRLRRVLDDFLQVVNVRVAVESKVRRQQICTRIVGDL